MPRNKLKRPGGTGFQPVHSFQTTRRNLPHWQQPGTVYFITWRLRDGQTLNPEERSVALEALRHWEGRKWKLYTAVILPDHVHVLAQPLPKGDGGFYNLAEVVQSAKGFSAYAINQKRGKQGSLWQDERYDRIVRDEAEFLEKWQYIRNNPVRAGLAQRPEDYPWLYEQAG